MGSTTTDDSLHPSPQSALARLLAAIASQGAEIDEAWTDFIAEHSRLLLHVCRTLLHDQDAAMDAYAFVLDALRNDGCARLRAYAPDGSTRFTTWLVVVARRLVRDHQRHQYGRPRSDAEERKAEHAVRRRIEDLVVAEIDPDILMSPADTGPDAAIRRQELTAALRHALGELEPSDRLLVALRFEDERPVREIARLLGMPTVFHFYRRQGVVLATLRRALARRGVEELEP